jgi:hypothetical protein
VTPLPLAYDDLPAGSDIRREYVGDGEAREVKIVVPAGEPSPAAMKAVLFDAFASGARASWALLLLALMLFFMGIRNNRVSGVALTWAWVFFGIFCAALVLLVAWVRYGMMLESLRIGREQMTVIGVTPARLLIETAGPFGVASYDFAREKIARVTVGHSVLRDDRNLARRVSNIAIALVDGRTILTLPARDERELRWVAATVRETMKLS